ncbi:hypothetical protein [Paraburkholderia sp. J94]|uniref:hypothetical protein n=1 Tax=Paraburkholderia sp. J94 TaxID=2805441 RepID=UPI002AB1D522|nr:hypothetical protein [Paraburkholderia sp. J94]
MKTLDALLNEPNTPLIRRAANKDDLRAWLGEADKKLRDAGNTDISESTRMDAAYDAVFFCALGVICTQGYRATSKPGHHVKVLEAAAIVMKLAQSLQDSVEALQDWRNRKYIAAFSATQDDVAEAIDTAKAYQAEVFDWLQHHAANMLK